MKNEHGVTLIELLAVVVIIGILALIAVPSVRAVIDRTEQAACDENLRVLKQDYEMHLDFNGVIHTDILFHEFYESWNQGYCVCRDGMKPYVQDNGEVMCNEEKDDDDAVPIL